MSGGAEQNWNLCLANILGVKLLLELPGKKPGELSIKECA
jgi:hypothetical protein